MCHMPQQLLQPTIVSRVSLIAPSLLSHALPLQAAFQLRTTVQIADSPCGTADPAWHAA